MTIKFFPNDKGSPAGKLAEVELHFTFTHGMAGALQDDTDPVNAEKALDGLKLIGFGI